MELKTCKCITKVSPCCIDHFLLLHIRPPPPLLCPVPILFRYDTSLRIEVHTQIVIHHFLYYHTIHRQASIQWSDNTTRDCKAIKMRSTTVSSWMLVLCLLGIGVVQSFVVLPRASSSATTTPMSAATTSTTTEEARSLLKKSLLESLGQQLSADHVLCCPVSLQPLSCVTRFAGPFGQLRSMQASGGYSVSWWYLFEMYVLIHASSHHHAHISFSFLLLFLTLPHSLIHSLPSLSHSLCVCVSVALQYTVNDCYANLIASSDEEQVSMNNLALRQDLFRSPFVSFLYERGWRNQFKLSGFPGVDQEFEEIMAFFEPIIEKQGPTTVVDLSCGSGLMTRRLVRSNKFNRVIAADYSESMLRETQLRFKREKIPVPELIRADAARLPFQTESVDAIHAGRVKKAPKAAFNNSYSQMTFLPRCVTQ